MRDVSASICRELRRPSREGEGTPSLPEIPVLLRLLPLAFHGQGGITGGKLGDNAQDSAVILLLKTGLMMDRALVAVKVEFRPPYVAARSIVHVGRLRRESRQEIPVLDGSNYTNEHCSDNFRQHDNGGEHTA
jgi:hypothetical protein